MKKLVTVKLPLAACLIGLSCSAFTQEMQEVIVTSSLIDASSDEISNPLHVISGESIATDASQSIGASIDGLVGISSSDYGAAVGQRRHHNHWRIYPPNHQCSHRCFGWHR